MNRMIESWKERFFPAEDGSSETLAAGSLAAGVGLFVLSMIMVLAIGFVAGALVLIEKVAHNVLGGEDEQAANAAAVPQRAIGEIEMA